MVVHLFSPNGRYDEVYLRNYASLQVKDVLARLPGAGSVEACRTFFDPVDCRDVRMVERGEHLGFPLKPREPIVVAGE